VPHFSCHVEYKQASSCSLLESFVQAHNFGRSSRLYACAKVQPKQHCCTALLHGMQPWVVCIHYSQPMNQNCSQQSVHSTVKPCTAWQYTTKTIVWQCTTSTIILLCTDLCDVEAEVRPCNCECNLNVRCHITGLQPREQDPAQHVDKTNTAVIASAIAVDMHKGVRVPQLINHVFHCCAP
jgi:hypothetical protein